ncbi:MAG: biopolymer transporter ExbD [Prevotellaceae bacterium]|nr:biopolymer transporter ExbD [Prevotellaceae bacterium]
MSFFRRSKREVPVLNTSSLPDLVFSVLFFFITVTHMRQVTLKVKYRVPEGTELTKLTKKSAVTYIYIGKPTKDMQASAGNKTRIQLNDKYADVTSVIDYVTEERKRMSPEDAKAMSVSIKADRSTEMGIINDVKQSLRKAGATRVNYSATSKGKKVD